MLIDAARAVNWQKYQLRGIESLFTLVPGGGVSPPVEPFSFSPAAINREDRNGCRHSSPGFARAQDENSTPATRQHHRKHPLRAVRIYRNPVSSLIRRPARNNGNF